MKSEWFVVALVAAGLGVAEVSLRAVQDSLSGDVAHLNTADSIVASVAGGEGLRVLMTGNSLLFRGVDPVALEARLERALGRQVTVGMVYPDGTSPLEWSYLYRRLLFHPGRLPDVMVVAFGPGHLRDRSPESVLLRLAAHHVDRRDIGLLFSEDLGGIEARSEFLLARASTAFALRDRISPRVYDRLIPRYRELAPILLRAPAAANARGGGAAQPTFGFLERLLDDAASAGVPIVALPMPAPEEYDVDQGAVAAFAEHGLPLLETQNGTGLEPARFPDREHLDLPGQARFTDFLAPILAESLRGIEPR